MKNIEEKLKWNKYEKDLTSKKLSDGVSNAF